MVEKQHWGRDSGAWRPCFTPFPAALASARISMQMWSADVVPTAAGLQPCRWHVTPDR